LGGVWGLSPELTGRLIKRNVYKMKRKNFSPTYQKAARAHCARERHLQIVKRQKKKRMERAKIEQSWGGLYD